MLLEDKNNAAESSCCQFTQLCVAKTVNRALIGKRWQAWHCFSLLTSPWSELVLCSSAAPAFLSERMLLENIVQILYSSRLSQWCLWQLCSWRTEGHFLYWRRETGAETWRIENSLRQCLLACKWWPWNDQCVWKDRWLYFRTQVTS